MRKHARVIVLALSLALAACGKSPARTERLSVSPGGRVPGERSASSAAPARKGLRLVKVGSFREPVYVTGAPGDAAGCSLHSAAAK